MGSNASNKAPAYALGLTGKCAEVLDRQKCTITGTLPSWLSGSTLLRNGAPLVGSSALDALRYGCTARG